MRTELTLSLSTSKLQLKQSMYSDHIAALRVALQKFVRPNTVNIYNYIGADNMFLPLTGDEGVRRSPAPADVPYTLNGVSIIQYSPFAGTSVAGCQQARARVWAEIDAVPTIDRTWPSNAGMVKRDDGSCKLWSNFFGMKLT